jgi:hypothetical protein
LVFFGVIAQAAALAILGDRMAVTGEHRLVILSPKKDPGSKITGNEEGNM